MGNRLNLMNRIQVDRAISGTSPCVKKPCRPCTLWKLESNSLVVNLLPAFAICRARTRSNGYIIAAVQNAADRMGAIDRIEGRSSDNNCLPVLVCSDFPSI